MKIKSQEFSVVDVVDVKLVNSYNKTSPLQSMALSTLNECSLNALS